MAERNRTGEDGAAEYTEDAAIVTAPQDHGDDKSESAVPRHDDEGGTPDRDDSSSRKGRLLVAAMILLVGLGASASLYYLRPEPSPEPSLRTAPLVESARAVLTDQPLIIEGNGVVEPVAEIGLSAQVSGRVEYVHPNLLSGGEFKRGETLLRLEPADYENRVAQARALVQQEQVEVRRAEEEARIARQELSLLSDRLTGTSSTLPELQTDFDASGRKEIRLDPPSSATSAIGPEEVSPLTVQQPQLEAARADLQSARAQLDDALLALERTRIEAPFAGHVRTEQIDVGQLVQPGAELARIYASEAVEIPVPLSSTQAALIPELWQLSAGGGGAIPAEVRVAYGGTEYSWSGRIDRAKAFINPESRTVDVVVRVDDPFTTDRGAQASSTENSATRQSSRPPLLVGTYATVLLRGRQPEPYLLVPVEALRDGSRLWVLSQETDANPGSRSEGAQGSNTVLNVVDVDILQRRDDMAAIRARSIKDGDRVVVSALDVVSDGMRVRTERETGGETRSGDNGSQ